MWFYSSFEFYNLKESFFFFWAKFKQKRNIWKNIPLFRLNYLQTCRCHQNRETSEFAWDFKFFLKRYPSILHANHLVPNKPVTPAQVSRVSQSMQRLSHQTFSVRHCNFSGWTLGAVSSSRIRENFWNSSTRVKLYMDFVFSTIDTRWIDKSGKWGNRCTSALWKS